MDYRTSKASSAYKNGNIGQSSMGYQGRSSGYGQTDGDRLHVRFSGVAPDSNGYRQSNYGGTGSNDGGYGRPDMSDATGAMMRGILNETNQKSAGTKYRPGSGMDPSCRHTGNRSYREGRRIPEYFAEVHRNHASRLDHLQKRSTES